MIITIRVTEAAIEHIKQETGLDEESAGDLAQILVGLYELKGSPDPDYKLPEKSSEREDRLEAVISEGFQILKRYGVNILRYRMDALPKAIKEAVTLPGPRLRRAAQDVVNLSHKSTTAESLFEAIGRLEQALGALPEGSGIGELWPNLSIRDLERIIDEAGAALGKYGVIGYTPEGLSKGIGDLARLPGPRLRRAAQALIDHDMPYDAKYELIIEELEQALRALPEGEGSEDRLYKTARTLYDIYKTQGSDFFAAQFGSLDILGPCQKIIEEGEGNPHPWE